jgi:Domain of unknown function (DUF5753)
MYQAPASVRDRLVKLGGSASRRGWWDAYDDTLSQGYSTLLALEEEAESELSYNQMLIPGILQTEAYAREVATSPDVPPGEIARRVAARVTRQRILTRDDPLELIAVLDEACLRRQVGGAAIMTEQISHLVKMARLPNVTLQVLPFSAGFHQGVGNAFKILHFREEGATDVVYLEHVIGDLFLEKEGEVYSYVRVFAGLRELALGQQESIAALGQISSEIEQVQEE